MLNRGHVFLSSFSLIVFVLLYGLLGTRLVLGVRQNLCIMYYRESSGFTPHN